MCIIWNKGFFKNKSSETLCVTFKTKGVSSESIGYWAKMKCIRSQTIGALTQIEGASSEAGCIIWKLTAH